MTRRPLAERREERARRSAEARAAHWQQRFARAQSPVDVVQETWAMLRARLVQHERKALARVDRAAPEERATAVDELAQARTEIEAICEEAAAELARLADRVQGTRR